MVVSLLSYVTQILPPPAAPSLKNPIVKGLSENFLTLCQAVGADVRNNGVANADVC